MGGATSSKMEPSEEEYLRLADMSDPDLLADPELLNVSAPLSPLQMPPEKPKRRKGKAKVKKSSLPLPLIPEFPEDEGLTSFMFIGSEDEDNGLGWEKVSMTDLLLPPEEVEDNATKSAPSDIDLVWRSMSSDVFSFYKERYPIPEDLEEEAEVVHNAVEDIVIQKDLPVSNDVYPQVENGDIFIPTTAGIENNIYLDLSWYIRSSVDDLIRAILEAGEKEVPDLVSRLLDIPIRSCAWAETFFMAKVYHNFVKSGATCTNLQRAAFWRTVNHLQRGNKNARKLIRSLTIRN